MTSVEPSTVPQFADDDRNHHFRTDHLKAELGRRSARGGAVTFGAQICKFALSTGSAIALARLLTPQDYGLIGMVAILVGFLGMFQYLGLSTATIQWADLKHEQVSALFWLNIALSAAIMLATIAAAPVAAWFYKEPKLIGITVGYAISILITGFYIQHEAILIRQMRFAVIAVVEVAAMAIGLAAAIVAAIYGAHYWSLVINQLVLATVSVIGMWAACRWRPSLPRGGAAVRSMLRFGSNVTGFNVMQYFARNADNALIGKFWGAYELGLYSRAYQMLLLPMQQINAPLASVAVPALSRLTDSPERYRDAYLKILEKLVMITMPLGAFMIATSDWLVLFLLGPQWKATGAIFMLLGIAAIIQPVTKTSWWLFSTQGRTRDLFHWGIIGAVIAVASIITGLPWGAKGVAATYAISDLCLTTPLLFWYVGRRGPVRAGDFYRTITPSAAATICALGTVILARPWLASVPLIPRLSLACVITFATALLVFAVLPTGRRAIRSLAEILILIVRRNPRSLTTATLK